MSRTDRETTSSSVRPERPSPRTGPCVVRARVGFSPTSPLALAGIRIEPPPSFAWATGTMPAAVAAPDPPLEPPVEREVSQGLRLAPWASGSVVGKNSELGRVRLADHHEPGGAKALGQVRVDGGSKIRVFERLISEVKGLARVRGAEILEQKGNALERAVGQRALRLGQPLLVELVDDCVDLGVDPLSALDRGFDELRRADVATADELRLSGCIESGEGVGHGVGTVGSLCDLLPVCGNNSPISAGMSTSPDAHDRRDHPPLGACRSRRQRVSGTRPPHPDRRRRAGRPGRANRTAGLSRAQHGHGRAPGGQVGPHRSGSRQRPHPQGPDVGARHAPRPDLPALDHADLQPPLLVRPRRRPDLLQVERRADRDRAAVGAAADTALLRRRRPGRSRSTTTR